MAGRSKTDPGLVLVGLGPGRAKQLTREAWDWLRQVDEVVVRGPVAAYSQSMLGEVRLVSLQSLAGEIGEAGDLADWATAWLVAGARERQVTYAIPGNPPAGDAIAVGVLRRAEAERLPVRVIPGVGLLDLALQGLVSHPREDLVLVDALELAGLHMPLFPPTSLVVITQLDSPAVIAAARQALLAVYPPDFTLRWARLDRLPAEAGDISLEALDRLEGYEPYTAIFLPPLGAGTSFESFQEIIAHLRAPNGCPWDRQQTHLTLRKHLLEETYETIQAMDAEDPRAMMEEFGDLLLQIVLNAQIASEAGEFRMADVIQGINEKIVRRHPHVFGDVQVEGVKGVLQNWEKLKAVERASREASEEENGQKGLLDGVPPVFPSLAQAQELQDRAARVGFDWPDVNGVLDKIDEEIAEVREAENIGAKSAEIGDLLFALVNLARWEHVDAESALREANARFRRRFAHIEAAARESGRDLPDLSLEEMDELWKEAKGQE